MTVFTTRVKMVDGKQVAHDNALNAAESCLLNLYSVLYITGQVRAGALTNPCAFFDARLRH